MAPYFRWNLKAYGDSRLLMSVELISQRSTCSKFGAVTTPQVRHWQDGDRLSKLTNLRGFQTLLGQLVDLLFDIIWSELQPLKIERKHSASDLGKLSE
jgi:hypothetical protein